MRRYIARIAFTLAATVALTGCAIGHAQGTRHAHETAPAHGTQRAHGTVQVGPVITPECELGYAVGPDLFPDTAAGYAAAVSDNGGATPHQMAHVTIANDNKQGITLNSYTVLIAYGKGWVVKEADESAGVFLAPGESYSQWVDLTNDVPVPAMSEAAFQNSTCLVGSWQ